MQKLNDLSRCLTSPEGRGPKKVHNIPNPGEERRHLRRDFAEPRRDYERTHAKDEARQADQQDPRHDEFWQADFSNKAPGKRKQRSRFVLDASSSA